jgi:hypothetical protein
MGNVAGTETATAWPPSPATVKSDTPKAAPPTSSVVVRAPVASIRTVAEPLLGSTTVPNRRSVFFVTVMGRRMVTVAVPVSLAANAGKIAALNVSAASAHPVITLIWKPLSKPRLRVTPIIQAIAARIVHRRVRNNAHLGDETDELSTTG